jgi:hypothetical protein
MDGEVTQRALNMDTLPMGQPLGEQPAGGGSNGETHDLSEELAERLKALGYLWRLKNAGMSLESIHREPTRAAPLPSPQERNLVL